jgi:hypothetical protein
MKLQKLFASRENDRRIVVQLAGGLGNQMFQYAAARALSVRLKGELVLDTWSGFVRDRVYRRSYELDAFPIKARDAAARERAPFWIDRSLQRISRTFSLRDAQSSAGPHRHRLNEDQLCFSPALAETEFNLPIWMTGYWQSPRYFQSVANLIVSELSPPEPKDPALLRLGAEMRDGLSVAVGIRLYEESPDPKAQSHNGKLKSPAEVNAALGVMAEAVPGARYYVFCTHRADFLDGLTLPSHTVFVTADDGYINSIDTLWLLSQCHHHIFTNSSFYWWGAWLSEKAARGDQPIMFAADNFSNRDTVPANWHRF